MNAASPRRGRWVGQKIRCFPIRYKSSEIFLSAATGFVFLSRKTIKRQEKKRKHFFGNNNN